MKKLLFSAVALVAFSSVSMGNTMELEATISNEDCCMYSAADQLEWMDADNSMTGAEANGLYQYLYNLCIEIGGEDLYDDRGNM